MAQFHDILDYLSVTRERGGSDLHLSVNSPPMIRRHGDLEPIPGYSSLTGHQLQESVYAILTERGDMPRHRHQPHHRKAQ